MKNLFFKLLRLNCLAYSGVFIAIYAAIFFAALLLTNFNFSHSFFIASIGLLVLLLPFVPKMLEWSIDYGIEDGIKKAKSRLGIE